MASDLISRAALLDSLKESKEGLQKIYDGLQYENEKRICSAEIMSFIEAILRVQEAPAVDAEPVRHGEWGDLCRGKMRICSCCKYDFDNTCNDIDDEWMFCPYCGAKMDAKDTNVPTKEG